MSLSGHKNESTTLHDTEFDRRKSKKYVLARRGYVAPRLQGKILSTTSWDKRYLAATFLCCNSVSQWERIPRHSPSHDREGKATLQRMEKAMKARKILDTDSIEELARFWDSHDLTDFERQMEDVSEPVFKRNPEPVIPIRLRRQEIEAVKRVAKTKGVRETALLRQWVREKLRNAKS